MQIPNIVVSGCNGCAKTCKTGGDVQVAEMAKRLRQEGKNVVLEVTRERTCYINHSMGALSGKEERLKKAPKGGAKELCVEMTSALLKEVAPMCQGVHFMPLGWSDIVPSIIEASLKSY
jgi:hypothetical protein